MSKGGVRPWDLLQAKGGVRPWDLLQAKKRLEHPYDAEKRLKICRECPELIKLTQQCKKCGCFMPLKVKLKAASCPIGKW